MPWQHITFTLPQELRDLFWLNRNLANQMVNVTAKIITKMARQKRLIPGIFAAIHTFGRDLKTNPHFHVSNTYGGISLDNKKWIPQFYIHHQIIKIMWKNEIVSLIRKLHQNKQLILPHQLHSSNFNSWINSLYNKLWVVHLQKVCTDHKRNIKYLGRYLKRPPLAETRILHYDELNVTYRFLDHHDKQMTAITLPIEEFIKRIIRHIPDSNFRLIRYYNWLSNRTRGTILPIVFRLIKQLPQVTKKISWSDLFYKSFGFDPLLCKNCNVIMQLIKTSFPNKDSLRNYYNNLAYSTLP